MIDPHEPDEKPRAKIVNLRNDTIGRLHKWGRLGEPAVAATRVMAARHFQRDYEVVEMGGAKAIDPTRQRVDEGGNHGGVDIDRRLQAIKKLGRIRQRLGVLSIQTYFGGEEKIAGADLLIWVLGENCSLTIIADRFGYDRSHLRLLPHLIECLDILAIEYGLALAPTAAAADRRTMSARRGPL